MAENFTFEYSDTDGHQSLCSPLQNSSEICLVIVSIRRSVSCISAAGCLFVIFVIWIHSQYTYQRQRLMLYLSITTFLVDVMHAIDGFHHENNPFCTFLGFCSQFLDLSEVIWVCCITHAIFRYGVQGKDVPVNDWWYIGISWGVCFLFNIIPLFAQVYGPAFPICWIIKDWKWRFGMFYIPFYIMVLGITITNISIFLYLRDRRNSWEGHITPVIEYKKQAYKENMTPLLAYPCIFLACYLPLTVNRIYEAVSNSENYPLTVLHAVFLPMVGFLYAVAVAVTDNILEDIKPSALKLACLLKFSRNDDQIRVYPIAIYTITESATHLRV